MTPEKFLWAPVKWAQRKDSLYVTIDLPDVQNENVVLTNKSLQFTGTSNGKQYEVKLEFFKEVDTEAKECKWAVGNRNVHFYILKKKKDEEFWTRLLNDKQLEKTNVKVDWNKYVDEDENDEPQGFDMSALGGGSGFDFGAMNASAAAGKEDEEVDSDDEDLPDLEEPGAPEVSA